MAEEIAARTTQDGERDSGKKDDRWGLALTILSLGVSVVALVSAERANTISTRISRPSLAVSGISHILLPSTSPGQALFRFHVGFKNVGLEPLNVRSVKAGYVDMLQQKFGEFKPSYGFPTMIHRDEEFNRPVDFRLPHASGSESPDVLSQKTSDWLDLVLVLVVEYVSTNDGVRQSERYFYRYKGKPPADHLSCHDYRAIEPLLAPLYRADGLCDIAEIGSTP